jgi:hypothetical protein
MQVERLSLPQETMDYPSHRLMPQLPRVQVSFSGLKHTKPFPTSEVFNSTPACTTPVTPLLIFPRRQVQAVAALSLQLTAIPLEGRSTEKPTGMCRLKT